MNEATFMMGKEHDLDRVNDALRDHVRSLGMVAVGALHVTCSDEVEYECMSSFQDRFVRHLLPDLKLFRRTAMHSANLGGRYEWGSVDFAQQHYAGASLKDGRLVLLIKINAHVAVEESDAGPRYGTMSRYDRSSSACGALHAMLAGSAEPYARQLREMFHWEGVDRAAMLLDPRRVDPEVRSLLLAVVSARLQARQAILEIQDRQTTTPTVYLIVPCVTLNRHDRDTELLCGLYTANAEGYKCDAEYAGLGDDPSLYEVGHDSGRLVISDEHLGACRPARDHRELVRAKWRTRTRGPIADEGKLHELVAQAESGVRQDHYYAKAVLKSLLHGLAALAPVPAAVVLFSEGLADLYHAHRAHHIAEEIAGDAEARKILDDVHYSIEQIDDEHARRIVDLLVEEYRR